MRQIMVGQREQLLEMHAAAERAALAALALAGLGMLLACSVAAAEAGFGDGDGFLEEFEFFG